VANEEPRQTAFRYTGHGIPQPECSKMMASFLEEHAPRLATRPVFVIHARTDSVSSFKDAEAIVEAIQAFGGLCELVEVPSDKANSDGCGKKKPQKKKSKSGHGYYRYSLLNKSSDKVLHDRLRAALERGCGADGHADASKVADDEVRDTPYDEQRALPHDGQIEPRGESSTDVGGEPEQDPGLL